MKVIKIELLIIFVLLFSSFQTIHYQPISKQDYYIEILKHDELIHEIFSVSKKYNIEPELMIALSMQESGLNQYAIGKNLNSLDKGFLQVNSQYFNHPIIYETSINVFMGISYFDYCLKRSEGNVRKALYLYNSGCDYAVSKKAEKRADLIIQMSLKLKYNYERYEKTYIVEYYPH